jgi:hypothetical protein
VAAFDDPGVLRLATLTAMLAMVVGCAGPRPPEPPPFLAPGPLGSVFDLETKDEGTYAVSGYVIQKHTCQPCPGPSPCVPCGPDGLSVSDHPPKAPGAARDGRVVVLRAERPEAYEGASRYRFVVEVRQVDGARELYVLGATELE